MKTIVDSAIWSLFFRKKSPTDEDLKIIEKLKKLAMNNDIIIIGSIRQETLSGFSVKEKFEKVKKMLSAYEDFPVLTKDYENAAEFFNLCRSHGIQGSHTDFLICAVAKNNDFEIFTTDNDFMNYSQFVDIKLTQSNINAKIQA